MTALDTISFQRAVWQPAAKNVPEHACLMTQNLLGNRSAEMIENLWKVLATGMFIVAFFFNWKEPKFLTIGSEVNATSVGMTRNTEGHVCRATAATAGGNTVTKLMYTWLSAEVCRHTGRSWL